MTDKKMNCAATTRGRQAARLAPLLLPAVVATERLSFVFPPDKPLHLKPSAAHGLIDDAPQFSAHPTFSVPSTYDVYYYSADKTRQIQADRGLPQTGAYDAVVPPVYYADAACDPPPASSGLHGGSAAWPGDGCACFEPDVLQTSFYDMSAEARDVPSNAFGYRTAFDTSVTGGLTIEGWFRASDTSGEPILAATNHPGIQYSHILTRGEKASWNAGFNFGMGKGSGFRFQVILDGPNQLTAQSPNYSWFPGIDVWHHVVSTYDAEEGRIAIYVDGVLQGEDFADPTWSRAQRDVRWGTDEAQVGKTRIGNGYDASDKNFFGCTGGLALYGGVAVPATAAANCAVFADAAGLQDAFRTSTDGVVNVCAGAAPLRWDETAGLDALGKIYLNAARDVRTYRLRCVIAPASSADRCLVDFDPADPASLSPSDQYGGFVLQDARELVVDGFEFVNRRGKNAIFYVQHGSRLEIANSVFRDNGQTVPEGNNPIIVYTYTTTEPVTTVIRNSVFIDNAGVLLRDQAGNLVLKDNIFYNNALPTNYESTYTYASFVSWSYLVDATFALSGNQFVGFQAPASSGTPASFWMVGASSPTSTPFTTDDLFAKVADDNCGLNNDVAGEELRSVTPTAAFGTCNNGAHGKATWPNVECHEFAGGTCAGFGAEGPPLPSASVQDPAGETIDACGLTASNRTAQITAIALGVLDSASYSSVVSSAGTPQFQALDFILSDANASELCPNVSDDDYKGGINAIRQMYLLLVLYFSTAGDSWTDNSGWLQSNNVCIWVGLSCTWNSHKVKQLALLENNLVGTIPSEMGKVDTLELLNLGNSVGATANNEFTNGIPTEIFTLSNLKFLKLTNTQLSGTISTEIGQLSSATQIYLDWNDLSGTLPTEIGSLSPSLGKLWLSGNDIVGPLPTQLGNLAALWELTFQNCRDLDGTIPTELGSLTLMKRLVLRNTGLSGSVPSELGNLVALTHLQLESSSSLSGTVPVCDGSAFNATYPDLATVTADCRAVSCTCCNGGNSCPSILTPSPSLSWSPTDNPTKTPTDAPTGRPTEAPSTDPTTDPSIDPSVNPTDRLGEAPSMYPTTDPSIDPSVNPTGRLGEAPSMYPTTDPSMDPSVDHSMHPSMDLSTNPTKAPADAETNSSTDVTTAFPTAPKTSPSTSALNVATTPPLTSTPTLPPTASPNPIGGRFTVTIPTTITFTDVNCDSVGQDNLSDITSVVESQACSTMDKNIVESCAFVMVSQDCQSLNDGRGILRLRDSRELATSSFAAEFVATIKVKCDTGCSISGYTAQDVADQLIAAFQNTLRVGIEAGSLISELRGATALLESSNAAVKFDKAVTTILVELFGTWYPDWHGGSGKCLNDGNEPYYMVYSGYTTNSLHACCQYYSSWDAFRCSGVTDTIPNGYYPAWGTTSSEVKCLASSENTPTPAYIVQNPNDWLENDIESCCSAHYDWAKIECIVNSGGILSSATPAANQWFVDWAAEKCVKNCDTSSDDKCGGYAEKWDDLFSTASECCEQISYIEQSECIL